MEINVFLVFIGLLLWPSLTVAIILWMMGHPLLAIMAFFVIGSGGTSERVVRDKL